MKQSKVDNIISAFNGLTSSIKLAEKIEVLSKKVRSESLRLGGEYWLARKKWCEENGLNIERDSANPKYLKRYDEDQKKIKVQLQPMNEELDKLLAEQKNAREKYIQMVLNNESWGMLVGRKSTPKILKVLNDNLQGITEVGIVEKVLPKTSKTLSDTEKNTRYCMVLYYMENLGWIKRIGSGNAYDAKVSFITDLGKKQLEMFRKNKSFDIGLQFNI